ncbi:MAG: hypothetical protein Pars2KO_00870 [Parasphingorhabdus sp.]
MTKTWILALALGVSGCTAADPAAESADTAVETSDPVVEDAKAEDSATKSEEAVPEDNAIRIKIEGFECGDNCYLNYSELAAAAEPQGALCSVDVCEEWFSMQEMPPEFVGRSAQIVLGAGKQYDNAGNVMSDDFAEVTSITIDPAE